MAQHTLADRRGPKTLPGEALDGRVVARKRKSDPLLAIAALAATESLISLPVSIATGQASWQEPSAAQVWIASCS